MAAKIVDGLFLGDALCSMDANFLVANKITRVINCAGMEIENRWHSLGIEYLTFGWTCTEESTQQQIRSEQSDDGHVSLDVLESDGIFSLNSNSRELIARLEVLPTDSQLECGIPGEEDCPCVWLDKVTLFIETALEAGNGVLVHSQDGRNRACTCILAYLMGAYRWDLEKSISFVQSKRPDLLPCEDLYNQLTVLSQWLEKCFETECPPQAQPAEEDNRPVDLLTMKFRTWEVGHHDLRRISQRADEEILLHNTFINSGTYISREVDVAYRQTDAHSDQTKSEQLKKSVQWIDSDHIVMSGEPVLRSPFSKRVLPERPPGPCYRSLFVTGHWIDTDGSLHEESLNETTEQSSDELNVINGGEPLESPKHILNSSQIDTSAAPVMAIPFFAQGLATLQQHKLDLNKLRQRLLRNGIAESLLPESFHANARPGDKNQATSSRKKNHYSEKVVQVQQVENVSRANQPSISLDQHRDKSKNTLSVCPPKQHKRRITNRSRHTRSSVTPASARTSSSLTRSIPGSKRPVRRRPGNFSSAISLSASNSIHKSGQKLPLGEKRV